MSPQNAPKKQAKKNRFLQPFAAGIFRPYKFLNPFRQEYQPDGKPAEQKWVRRRVQ